MLRASPSSSSRNVLPTDLPSHVAARLRARQQNNVSSPLKASVSAASEAESCKSANEQSVLVDRLAREVRQIETVGRQATHKATISCGCAALDHCLPDKGYAPGSVVEYLRAMPGCGASTLALTAAATAMRSTQGFVVVVDTQHDIYPPALASWGIDLEKVVLVRPQSDTDALWAIDQSLRTPAVAAVVADLQRMDDRAARRLQLAAEQGGGLALLVRPIAARRGPSWADVQWIVRALPSRDVGPTQNVTPTSMVLEWKIGDCKFNWYAFEAARQVLRSACRSVRRMARYTRSNAMNQRVLCIWLPNWPVQRVQAAEPLLAERPLVLQTRDSRRGLIVAAANLAARAQGVRAQMSISEASGLTELNVRQYDLEEDLDQLCNLAEQAQQFSPIVGLEQLDKKLWAGRNLLQPEALLLDVTGLANLFGGEQQLLALIAQWLYDQRYFGCMAIGDSVGAAWAIANYAHRKRAASSAGADNKAAESIPIVSQYTIAACGDPVAIEQLPIAALRLPVETVQMLMRLGVHFIAQLAQLPRDGMATRLGQALLDRWDQALGRKAEPLVALHVLPELQLEQTLEYPTEHRATMEELVRRMSVELARRMSDRGKGAMRIVCRLDQVEASPLVMQLSLFRPTADPHHLQMLLVGQLEQQLGSRPTAAVWRVAIQATLTAPLAWHQTDLFEGDVVENRHQFARLVDNLSNRLGRRQVLRARIEREPQPEHGCTLQPMTGRRPDGAEQATLKKISSRLARHRAEPSPDDPMRRPTRLLHPPQSIEVIALAPEGLPAQFKSGQQPYTVIQYWGPERLESGWWRGPSVRRDYFRVETEHGAWWWIYRDMQTNTWYLHGVFD